MSAQEWARYVESHFPAVPDREAIEIQSRLLLATAQRSERLTAVRAVVAGRPIELQIHRVLAGRYGMENTVAVCAAPHPTVQGSAELRMRDRYRMFRMLRKMPWFMRLLSTAALPLLFVLFVPGYLLIVPLSLLLKRQQGIRNFSRVASRDVARRFVVEGRTEEEVRAALPKDAQKALARTVDIVRFQLRPGVIVAEALLDHRDALDTLFAARGDLARLTAPS
jgi:hypothetical protein